MKNSNFSSKMISGIVGIDNETKELDFLHVKEYDVLKTIPGEEVSVSMSNYHLTFEDIKLLNKFSQDIKEEIDRLSLLRDAIDAILYMSMDT